MTESYFQILNTPPSHFARKFSPRTLAMVKYFEKFFIDEFLFYSKINLYEYINYNLYDIVIKYR